MAYDITISGRDTHIMAKVTGEIHVSQVLGMIIYFYHDPEYTKVGKLLWDLRELSIAEGGKELMRTAMQHMENRTIEEPISVALVATDYRILTLAETYRLIVKELPVTIEVFDEMEEAKAWLFQ